MKPNEYFKITVEDTDLIETVMRFYILHGPDKEHECLKILGQLHNDKNWYRPKNKPYISG